jgi:outer membrane protein TolC
MTSRPLTASLAALPLLAAGCGAWRAEARRFDEGAETAYFREQVARAERPGPEHVEGPLHPEPVEGRPEPVEGPARRKGWDARIDAADHLAGLLPPVAGELLRAAASDEETERALAAKPLDIETVRALAAVRSPAARAALESWRATVEQIEQAAWLEDLLAAFRPFTRTLDTGVGEQPQKGMTSSFAPWPSTVALRGEMADAEIAMAREEARAAAVEAVAKAEEAWFEQWHAEESLRLKSGFLETLKRTAGVAARRYAAGQGMQEEALRLGVEIADLDADVARHRAERAAAVSRLNGLLSRPAEAALPETGSPRFPESLPPAERAEAAARESSPMARAKGFAADEARVAVRMAETMLHGQPATAARLETGRGLEAGADRSMETMPAAPMAEASLLYGPEEAYLRELRRRVEAAGTAAEAARREAGTMAREAWTAVDTALREARVADRSTVPLARQALELSTRAYEAGSGRFADLMQAWWMSVEAQHGAVEARMRAGFARAALLRAVGTEITERPR